MKDLGLVPSRPRPSTFPYIPTEYQEMPATCTSPTSTNTATKTDNVAILPSRPQINVDLNSSPTAAEFGASNEKEKIVPLLAQPQIGSQERHYFSSNVT
mgnify:CR=1 FL=1